MRILKFAGIGLGGLIGLLLVFIGILYLIGSSKVNRTYDAQIATLVVASDSQAVAHGAHLVSIYGCNSCHGGDLGGEVMIDEPPFRVTAANLTAGEGGLGTYYSDEDFDRAIRHGVRPDGRGLVVMPSSVYHDMSPEDIAAVIAYLRSVEPVDRELPPTLIRPMGRLLAAALIDPAAEVRPGPARAEPAPPRGVTPEYGHYLAGITCAHCHGGDLRGGYHPSPGGPPAPDLAAAGHWPLDGFITTLRTGVTPAGREMDPYFMPVSVTKTMTDEELAAVHSYLATLTVDV